MKQFDIWMFTRLLTKGTIFSQQCCWRLSLLSHNNVEMGA